MVQNYLNTSHVKVNQDKSRLIIDRLEDLNTSHVKVNRNTMQGLLNNPKNLNTSHVKVNLGQRSSTYSKKCI